MLAVGALVTTASTNVVACNDSTVQPKPTPPPVPWIPIIITKIDISKKIPDKINLGQLSANTKEAFLEQLQAKLKVMADLNAIQRSDYHVYQVGTRNEIEDNDVINNTSLSIKIETTKNKNFTGIKDKIIVNYSKKFCKNKIRFILIKMENNK